MTKNEALFRAQVQIACEALRISARDLQAAIKRESQIYIPLFGHSHILNKQVVQAVACHHFHNIDQRLARWLLLVRERLRACEATGGDALILEAIDAEARRYHIDLDAASVRDESAIRRRTAEVEQEARRDILALGANIDTAG